MNQQEQNCSFEIIHQQIQALEGYLLQPKLQQQEAMAALQSLAAAVRNLEAFTEEMQANLEIIQEIEQELLQQNGTNIIERQVYHDLFKFAPNASLVTNAEGIIIEANYMAGALLNVLPSLLVGKSLTKFVSPATHSVFINQLQGALKMKTVTEIEVSIYPRHRQALVALLLVKPGRETSGMLGALQISLYDITKYKQLKTTQSMSSLNLAIKPGKALDGLRVLFVDDEADTRDLIQAVLMQQGVEVKAVATVAEALAELEKERPDLLMSDIRMPDEDGYTLIRKIKALQAEKGWQIPTVALTAYLAEDRIKAMQAGFQSHLYKLAEPTQLIAMVAQLARRG